MNAKERFNHMTEFIEQNVCNYFEFEKPIDLANAVASKMFLNLREMNVVMQFLAERTLIDYIKERKLIQAYIILSQGEKKLTELIEECNCITGFGDHSAFDKAFKRQFRKRPKDIYGLKDCACITEPLTWDAVSDTDNLQTGSDQMNEVIEYEKVLAFLDMEAEYGLAPMFNKYALELSKNAGFSLEKAFQFVNSLHDFGGDFQGEDDVDEDDEFERMSPEESLRSYGDDEFYRYMFFERGVPVSLASDIEDYGVNRSEIKDADPDMLRYYYDCVEYAQSLVPIRFSYFRRAWEYYQANADDDYSDEQLEEFIGYIDSDIPIEVAFDMVLPSIPDDIGKDVGVDYEAEHEAFDDWADLETTWGKDRFDREPDMDNLAYEEDDVLFDGE